MQVSCFALEPGGGLRPEDEAAAIAGWKAGAGPYWVDLSGGEPDVVMAWLAGLDLDASLLDQMRLGDNETKFLPRQDAVFVAYPVPAAEGSGGHVHFSFLCLDRLLVTLRESPNGVPLLEEIPLESLTFREPTTAGVVCTLAVVHATRLRRHVQTLRREGDALTNRMDSSPQTLALSEVLALKRQVLALDEVVDEEVAVLDLLKLSNRPVLPLMRLAEAFEVAVEMTRATHREIDRLDRRVSDVQQRYESAQQQLTNRRLGLLTAISVIFMPLTLIAGIYGMNFDFMPELHFRYGYLLVLVAMALLAAWLYRRIRTRWLQ